MKIDEDSDLSMEREEENMRQIEEIEKKIRKQTRPDVLNNNFVEFKKGK